MAYVLRTKDNAGDLGRAADQNQSVDNDIEFNTHTTFIFQTIVAGADVTSVSFTPIPSTFTDLRLVIYCRGDDAATYQTHNLIVNNDTGNNYDSIYFQTRGTGDSVHEATESFGAALGIATWMSAAANSPADAFDCAVIEIPNYAGAVGEKCAILSGTVKNTEAANGIRYQNCAGWWRSTSAITRLDITTKAAKKFKVGSVFTLYGIP